MTQLNNQAELLPCPFCGGEAQLITDFDNCYIGCKSCYISTVSYDCYEGAAITWNRRTAIGGLMVPDGWKLTPIEPTMDMVVDGFEAVSEFKDSEEYEEMSGCQKSAMAARICWKAMLD